ncbi:TPA: glycosyltransferase family 4 protein [Vibrio vulnificus]|nr:glycosyltransferase family 4 protein [Vibrio vulnificus]HDY7712058.1 glycosyltransferase family 4 protein [Vibrio vulnificus]
MDKIILAFKIIKDALFNYFSNAEVFYIIENADWSIKHDGMSIKENLDRKCRLTITHLGIRNSIVHYGSINTYLTDKKIKNPHKSNKIVVTWFHITPNDLRIKRIKDVDIFVDFWHTSCSLTKVKLCELGIKENKIKVIPLGVDCDYFKPANNNHRNENRVLKIGSFQKDGEGWGEGDTPKLIKGPDIFVNAVKTIAKKYNIFVVLTGPARGYVKKNLTESFIEYEHHYLRTPNEVASYYQKIDYYIISSREEGGPKSVLESLACGVPLLTTNVGMVSDIIIDGVNGFIINEEKEYLEKIELLEHDSELRHRIIQNGLDTIKDLTWSHIAYRYSTEIYGEFL